MRVSKKFPIAVHTLLIASHRAETGKVTSEQIARSTGSNPVVIRNIFAQLKQAGLIEASTGKNGGVRLAKAETHISLWDIYSAVETEDTDEIFKFHAGSDSCPVGQNIYGVLHPHMDDALNAMKRELQGVTLAALVEELGRALERGPNSSGCKGPAGVG